jgi:GNAT superfamily N-acetyltransferase
MQEHPIAVLRLSDLDLELARKAMTEVNGRAVNDVAVQEFLRDPSCYLIVALNGYALRRPYRPEPQFLLYEVDVRPNWQNQGIGKKLVSAFIEEARRRGAFEVWVLTERSNETAVSVYRHCGLSQENPDANAVMMNILLDRVRTN